MSSNQGYVWVPWIVQTTTEVISENDFKPKSMLKSRYSTVMTGTINNGFFTVETTNYKRKKKIQNIFNIETEKPTE